MHEEIEKVVREAVEKESVQLKKKFEEDVYELKHKHEEELIQPREMRSKRRRELREKNQNGEERVRRVENGRVEETNGRGEGKIFNSSPRRGSTSCKRKCKRR